MRFTQSPKRGAGRPGAPVIPAVLHAQARPGIGYQSLIKVLCIYAPLLLLCFPSPPSDLGLIPHCAPLGIASTRHFFRGAMVVPRCAVNTPLHRINAAFLPWRVVRVQLEGGPNILTGYVVPPAC